MRSSIKKVTTIRRLATHIQLPRFLNNDVQRNYRDSLVKLIWPTIFTLGVGTCTFMAAHSINNALVSYHMCSKNTTKSIIISAIGLNCAIFLGWRLAFLHASLNRYFILVPQKPTLPSLLLSTFSHREGAHLFFNMFALYSFAGIFSGLLSPGHFIAFYLTSGTVVSLGSLCWTYFFQFYRLANPSLGASGALYALLGLTAATVPENRVAIIFFAFYFCKDELWGSSSHGRRHNRVSSRMANV
jgi:membrane associated rhomboid family serine protease